MIKTSYDFPFIRFPKALIENPMYRHISIEARMILAILIDRMFLSLINSDKYTDENGETFLIYTVNELCEKMCIGRGKVLTRLRELENNGMIARKRYRPCKPSRIYIMPHIFNDLKSVIAMPENETTL